jgi:hypothetical protein
MNNIKYNQNSQEPLIKKVTDPLDASEGKLPLSFKSLFIMVNIALVAYTGM